MTREDTIKILSVLRGAYPAFYRDITKQEAESTIALWESMFDEEPYELVGAAVKAFISGDGKGFPPAIGQIKERIRQITQPEEMTEQEAWSYVSKALRNSTYGSEEEFAKLPPEIKAVVHDPGQLRQWAIGPAEDLETVIASNFMRSFRAKQKTTREYMALPTSVKQLMISAGYKSDPTAVGLVRLMGGDSGVQGSGASGDWMDSKDRLPLLDAGDGGGSL
jgi:hypothetical protein